MIDTTIPVRFYDDRCKTDINAYMTKVLYQNLTICLCEAVVRSMSIFVLFDLETGEVLSNNLQFWYAENYG